MILKWVECVLNPHTFSYQSRLFCLWSKLLNVCTRISRWQLWEIQRRDFIILCLPVIMETSHLPMEWWQVRENFLCDLDWRKCWVLDQREWWQDCNRNSDLWAWKLVVDRPLAEESPDLWGAQKTQGFWLLLELCMVLLSSVCLLTYYR